MERGQRGNTKPELTSERRDRDGSGAYIITGRAIHTMDREHPRAEAVGVIGDRIVAVGTVEEVVRAMPRDAARFDVGSRTVVPGFTDSHNHFAYLARKWQAVDLDGCPTVDAALERVSRFLKERPEVAWIDGHGWDGNVWGELPTRADLDRIVSDRPVALSSKDGHALWANTKALQAARLLGGGGEDVPFDRNLVVRDSKTGEPTGIVYETAVKFVLAALPPVEPSAVAEAIAAGIPRLHAQGITAIHCPEQPDDWRAYEGLRAEGRLGVRVTYWLPVAQLEEAIALGLATGVGDEWLRFGPVKLFADGTLGQRTAAMLAPYEGEADNVGVWFYDDDELVGLIRRGAENGWAVAIHAIGDGAVRQGLDAFEAAGVVGRAVSGRAGGTEKVGRLRHRIEHAQLVHPDDVGRFAKLGIVASMQPLHCPADRANAERYWGARTAHAFPFRSLVDSGATLSFGSDAPFGLDLTVDSFSVLGGIDAAVNRRDENRGSSGQAIAVDEALRAFTIDAAYAGGEEGWRGSLTPGKVADVVVLNEDLHAVAPDGIADVRVDATIVAGRLVHGKLG